MVERRTPDDDRGKSPPDGPKAPETPTDEPQPVPVQDPPAEPDRHLMSWASVAG